MALRTLGTASTTSLRALMVAGDNSRPGANIQDVAAYNALVKSQVTQLLSPTAYMTNGVLHLPQQRGVIQCLPGDYIVVDPVSGWPMVLSSKAAASASFIHT